jgi:hypothetical protein
MCMHLRRGQAHLRFLSQLLPMFFCLEEEAAAVVLLLGVEALEHSYSIQITSFLQRRIIWWSDRAVQMPPSGLSLVMQVPVLPLR